MKSTKLYSIKTKLIVTIVVLMLLTNLTIGLLSYYTAKSQLDASGKIILTNGVSMVKEAIHLQQEEVMRGNKTLDEAQEAIKQLILGPKDKHNHRPLNRKIDLGENGYFFIMNGQADELAHPSIEGQNTWDTKDMSGQDIYVARDIIEKAQRNGGGFTYYSWQYPYTDRIAPKVSYAEMDDHWDWIIVSTIYMEDFNKGADNILHVLMLSSILSIIIGVIAISYINHHISKPIISIANGMKDFVDGDMNYSPILLKNRDEIKLLSLSFNSMAKTVQEEIKKRKHTESALKEINSELENRVIERTDVLNKTNQALEDALDLSEQQKETLTSLNFELEQSLEDLQQTQKQLIESEKMAAIGNLVAGIAHEINTPLGISITLNTYIESLHRKLSKSIKNNSISKQEFQKYSQNLIDSIDMQLKNLDRAAELVSNFKNISIDHHFSTLTPFNLKEHLDFILLGLKHHNTLGHQINLKCSKDLVINSYPSILSQLFSNLILNSFLHGFDQEQGSINITLESQNRGLTIQYSDNGSGIPKEHQSKIFDPFFTTNRQNGGTGLGLFMVYNLITHKLKGTIQLTPDFTPGVQFIIQIPL